MNLEEKLEFYDMLIRIGFKEIEVGFPAASETEYDFLRALIDGNRIPNDVTVQVLTSAVTISSVKHLRPLRVRHAPSSTFITPPALPSASRCSKEQGRDQANRR